MGVHVPGLIAVIVFYLLILAIGIWAARKAGLRATSLKIDDVMMANRSIGMFLGMFTMTATWVGGGYINGSTEVVAGDGLVWCQAPVGFSISLLFGGLFFAEKMRTSGFTTMLDPFHWKYGELMNCLLYLPALTGDVFWSASILSALGATLKVILDINLETAIIVSTAVALVYTLLGGLYSVAYTDVIQLICIFVGLKILYVKFPKTFVTMLCLDEWICVPFALTHEATQSIATDGGSLWTGELTPAYIANYIDFALLLIFGGIPWQVYWQRALAAKTVKVAKVLSYFAGVGCVVMAIPAVILGAVARSTAWNETSYGNGNVSTIQEDDKSLTLPLVMRHLCPTPVTFIGLGAVSAAVMSSTDSAILSSSCMFSRNVFRIIWYRVMKTRPSETLQVWVMRGAQVVIAILACAMALTVDSIYELFVLCADFVYVILFPQLLCVMYLKRSNSYGSLVAFILGLLFRLLGGDNTLDIPAVIIYPWYDHDNDTQLFPFRTLSMLISLFSLIIVSYLTDFLFTQNIIPLQFDIYGCFQADEHRSVAVTPNSYVLKDGLSVSTHVGVRKRGDKQDVSDHIKAQTDMD